jgi:hypothetical protein
LASPIKVRFGHSGVGLRMKPVTYITSFRKLILTEPITGYVELIPGVNITNNSQLKAQWLTSQCHAAVGAIEATHLEGESNLVFGEFEVDDMKGLPPERFLLVVLAWLDMLLKNAWLVKDHAMECDAAFLRAEIPEGVSWTKNFLAIRPSFSDGYTDKNIEMSIGELKEWGHTNDLVEGYLCEAECSSMRFMMEKGYARSGRAMQFVVAARRAQDLAFKIANYCSALETLYNRREVFATIKSAYNVRSKLVHGDTLKQNQIEDLPALSTKCDVTLRTILREIFRSEELKNIFDSHNNAVEDYFTRLILGLPTASSS